MKTIINILALVLLSSVAFSQIKKQDKIVVDRNDGFPYTGEYSEFYDNGSLKLKATFVDGYADGKYFTYYADGTLKEARSYKNGVFHGTWISYDQNGDVLSSANYTEGLKDGEWEINDMFANKTIKLQYENGVRTNAEYEENGVVYMQ